MNFIQKITLLFLMLCMACHTAHKEDFHKQHYSEDLYTTATAIAANGLPQQAIALVDSTYRRFPRISLLDQYRYYKFRSITCRRNKNEDTQELGYLDSMIHLVEQNEATRELSTEYAGAFYLKGDYFLRHRLLVAAYRNFANGQMICRQSGDSCATVGFTSAIAAYYYRQGKYQAAKDNYLVALGESAFCSDDKTKDYQPICCLSNLGICFNRLMQPDSSLKYHARLIDFIQSRVAASPEQKHYFETCLGIAYGNMAQAYQAKNQYKQAEQLFRQSIAINAQPGYDNKDATVTRLHLAELYLSGMGDYTHARQLLQETSKVLDVNDPETRLLWLRLQWLLDVKTGSANALDASMQFYRFTDSLHEVSDLYQSTDFRHIIESEERKYEIDKLAKDRELKQTYIRSLITVAVLTLIIIVILTVYYRKSVRNAANLGQLNQQLSDRESQLKTLLDELESRKEQKRKEDLLLQAIELQSEHQHNMRLQRTKISNDMHDELSNELMALLLYIKDCSYKVTVPGKDIIDRIYTETSSVYDGVRNYIHRLHQGSTYYCWADITKFLKELQLKFSSSHYVTITYFIDERFPGHLLNSIQAECLYYILREAIANIIKHSNASAIAVTIQQADNTCHINITDNGHGFNEQGISYGLGLRSMEERIQYIGGTLSITSAPGAGTTIAGQFRLSVPPATAL